MCMQFAAITVMTDSSSTPPPPREHKKLLSHRKEVSILAEKLMNKQKVLPRPLPTQGHTQIPWAHPRYRSEVMGLTQSHSNNLQQLITCHVIVQDLNHTVLSYLQLISSLKRYYEIMCAESISIRQGTQCQVVPSLEWHIWCGPSQHPTVSVPHPSLGVQKV